MRSTSLDPATLQVNVTRGAASVVRRQQHPTLENQVPRVRRPRQSIEKAFQRIDLVQFVGRPPGPAGKILKITVDAAGHNRISNAPRSAGSACGK
jgi:hypothetical protein